VPQAEPEQPAEEAPAATDAVEQKPASAIPDALVEPAGEKPAEDAVPAEGEANPDNEAE